MAYESYISGYRRRLQEERRIRERARQELLSEVRSLSSYFDALPDLRRVYVFGSAADPDRFTSDSDLDLAFEDLPADRFCTVLSELVEKLGRSVDALRLEDAPEALRSRIVKGVIVYERRPQ